MMLQKISPLLLLCAIFALGFAAGYISRPSAIKRTETHTEARSESQTKSQVQSHSSVTKNATTGSISKIEKVYYCPNGNLKKEVRIERKQEKTEGVAKKGGRETLLDYKIATHETASTITEYKSSWGLGIMLPELKFSDISKQNYNLDWKDTGILATQRIFGSSFWLIAEVKPLKKSLNIGILKEN